MSDNTPNPAPADAAIQQLNLGYNAEQDRLLFRVGLSDNTELMVWLTCRITKQLWVLLNGETHLPTASSIKVETPPTQAVQQFKQEIKTTQALQQMDFQTAYQPRPAVRNDTTLLATALTFNSQGAKYLDITCLEGVNVRMNLTEELILAMVNMLQLAVKEAHWDIGAPQPSSLVISMPEQKVLH